MRNSFIKIKIIPFIMNLDKTMQIVIDKSMFEKGASVPKETEIYLDISDLPFVSEETRTRIFSHKKTNKYCS